MTLRKRVDELKKVWDGIWTKQTKKSGLLLGFEQSLKVIDDYQQLLDRAMQGLEELDGQLQIVDPSPSTLGYMQVITRQTLADIRKQLDGDGK